MSDMSRPTQTSRALAADDLAARALAPRSRIFALSLLANCCFVNLGLAPLIEALDEPLLLIGMAYGTLGAELAVVSLWTVWSERHLWQRLLVGSLAAEALAACFVGGIGLSRPRPSDYADVVRAILCSVPLVLLAIQGPLWALRTYAGWRITITGSSGLSRRPLSIGDLLWCMVAVAGAISLARLASSDPQYFDFAWVAWAVALPSLALVSLLCLPPAVFLALRIERPLIGLWGVWGYATVALLAALMVIGAFTGDIPDGELIALWFISAYSFAAILWGALRLVRSWEYRLAIRGSSEAVAA
jgi:hypothetical protein